MDLLKKENLDVSVLQEQSFDAGTQPSTHRKTQSRTSEPTARSKAPHTLYHNIPTQNIRFEKFIKTLFASPMSKEDIADEIILYQQAMESSYNEKARVMREKVDREKKRRIKAESVSVNVNVE